MPTTRSTTRKQAKLDDFKHDGDTKEPKLGAEKRSEALNSKNPSQTKSRVGKSNTSAKRKTPADDEKDKKLGKKVKPDPHTSKQAQISTDDTQNLEQPIIVNRSPVLQLWAATVAQFLYPSDSWQTCLSVGGSIATLCAISKGRAIGQLEPKDDSGETDKARKRGKEGTEKEARKISVMGFPMRIRNDVVVVDGKPKPLKEALLKGRFGSDSNYEKAKLTMQQALQAWEDNKAELDKKAFHMYEQFRPQVSSGIAGWGRKGELSLHKVKSSITERQYPT